MIDGMLEAERRQPAEIGRQFTRAFGGDVEGKRLDGDGPVLLRVVGAKHGTEHADTHLVHDAESTECRRRWRTRRRVSGQRSTLLS